MPNPRLTAEQLTVANEILSLIRERLDRYSAGDRELRFALNRKLAKELQYDERGKPMQRKRLKAQKRKDQQGSCTVCLGQLPKNGAVLDRLNAMDGYVAENTRLICQRCDTQIQAERGFS